MTQEDSTGFRINGRDLQYSSTVFCPRRNTTTLHGANIQPLRVFATARSLNQIIKYGACNTAEVFLTLPLQIGAGSVAGSKWMSDDLYKRAASTKKNFHVVEG